jgi:hypothetical protein
MACSGRRRQAKDDYEAAIVELQSVLSPQTVSSVRKFDFSKVDILGKKGPEQLGLALDSLLQDISRSKDDKKRWQKFKNQTVTFFRSSYPFAKVFLSVATNASAVYSLLSIKAHFVDSYPESIWTYLCRVDCAGRCIITFGGLLTPSQVAYEVTDRSREIEGAIKQLSNQVCRVRIITELPEDLDPAQLDDVHCAALELASSIVLYLGVAIQHFKRAFISELHNHIRI